MAAKETDYAEAKKLLSMTRNTAREFLSVYEVSKEDDIIGLSASKLTDSIRSLQKERDEVQSLLHGLQQQVTEAEHRLRDSEVDHSQLGEIESLKRKVDEMQKTRDRLKEELRVIEEEVEMIKEKLKNIDSQKEALRKAEAMQQRAHNEFVLYAQVSKIVPDIPLVSDTVSGKVIMDKQWNKTRDFELDPSQMSTFEVSQALWHMDLQMDG